MSGLLRVKSAGFDPSASRSEQQTSLAAVQQSNPWNQLLQMFDSSGLPYRNLLDDSNSQSLLLRVKQYQSKAVSDSELEKSQPIQPSVNSKPVVDVINDIENENETQVNKTEFSSRESLENGGNVSVAGKHQITPLEHACPFKVIDQYTNEVEHYGKAVQIKWDSDGSARKKMVEHNSQTHEELFAHDKFTRRHKSHTHLYHKRSDNDLGPKVEYNPIRVLRDGFQICTNDEKCDIVSDLRTAPTIELFPPPESTSIVFHSIQGNLFRKLEKFDLIDEETVASIVKQSAIPLAHTRVLASMQMDSTTELSQFLHPSTSLKPDRKLTRQNLFWNLFSGQFPSHWVPDKNSNTCSACSRLFTFYYRRHHCRACGQIFCHGCTMHRSVTDSTGQKLMERQCSSCAK